MNPQTIVYIGLIILAIGITVSAIDPLKPHVQKELKPVYMEIEVPNSQSYYVDVNENQVAFSIESGSAVEIVVDLDGNEKYSVINLFDPNGEFFRSHRVSTVDEFYVFTLYTNPKMQLGVWTVEFTAILKDNSERTRSAQFEITEEIIEQEKQVAPKGFILLLLAIASFTISATLFYALWDEANPTLTNLTTAKHMLTRQDYENLVREGKFYHYEMRILK